MDDDLATIGVVGAGAIGGWTAARLALAGHDVAMLARGATLAALRASGLRYEAGGTARTAPVRAADDAAALGPRDVVAFAVKAHDLPAAAAAAQAMIGPDTIILPMLNGVPWWFLGGAGGPLASVDPDGVLPGLLPDDRVLGCVVHAALSAPEPGRIVHGAGNGLIIGERGGGVSARVRRLCDTFAAAGFDARASADVRADIWYKLWGNMTMNPISAVTGADGGAILDDPLLEAFILTAMEEARRIGAAIGCPIAESGADRIAVTRRLGAFRTSMLQDALAGRRLELGALIAAPREIAARHAIPTPALDALHGIARTFAAAHGLA